MAPRVQLPTLRAFLGAIALTKTTARTASRLLYKLQGGLTENDIAVRDVVNAAIDEIDSIGEGNLPSIGGGDEGKVLGVVAGAAAWTEAIADGSVTAAKLATDAVETAKIKDGAVTDAKLGTSLDGSKLADGSVPAAKLAATGVTPGSYTNANVTIDAQGRITAAANGSTAPITVVDITAPGTLPDAADVIAFVNLAAPDVVAFEVSSGDARRVTVVVSSTSAPVTMEDGYTTVATLAPGEVATFVYDDTDSDRWHLTSRSGSLAGFATVTLADSDTTLTREQSHAGALTLDGSALTASRAVSLNQYAPKTARVVVVYGAAHGLTFDGHALTDGYWLVTATDAIRLWSNGEHPDDDAEFGGVRAGWYGIGQAKAHAIERHDVRTTSATTAISIATLTPPSNCAVDVYASILGTKSDASASYRVDMFAHFRVASGAITLVDTVEKTHEKGGTAGSIDTDSGAIRIRLTPPTSDDWRWSTVYTFHVRTTDA